jgi:hypothetical protein
MLKRGNSAETLHAFFRDAISYMSDLDRWTLLKLFEIIVSSNNRRLEDLTNFQEEKLRSTC